jgi:drug/metabolite transporter (DMT)-like permease
MYAIPLAALAWSWVILGIVPAVASLLGGLLILVGVVIVQLSKPVKVA